MSDAHVDETNGYLSGKDEDAVCLVVALACALVVGCILEQGGGQGRGRHKRNALKEADYRFPESV